MLIDITKRIGEKLFTFGYSVLPQPLRFLLLRVLSKLVRFLAKSYNPNKNVEPEAVLSRTASVERSVSFDESIDHPEHTGGERNLTRSPRSTHSPQSRHSPIPSAIVENSPPVLVFSPKRSQFKKPNDRSRLLKHGKAAHSILLAVNSLQLKNNKIYPSGDLCHFLSRMIASLHSSAPQDLQSKFLKSLPNFTETPGEDFESASIRYAELSGHSVQVVQQLICFLTNGMMSDAANVIRCNMDVKVNGCHALQLLPVADNRFERRSIEFRDNSVVCCFGKPMFCALDSGPLRTAEQARFKLSPSSIFVIAEVKIEFEEQLVISETIEIVNLNRNIEVAVKGTIDKDYVIVGEESLVDESPEYPSLVPVCVM